MKQDQYAFLVLAIIIPILFSPILIQGIEPSYYQVEVEYQYLKNPTELKSTIQLQDSISANEQTFKKYIINLSDAIEVKEDYSVLIPPDISEQTTEIHLTEKVMINDELNYVLEKSS